MMDRGISGERFSATASKSAFSGWRMLADEGGEGIVQVAVPLWQQASKNALPDQWRCRRYAFHKFKTK